MKKTLISCLIAILVGSFFALILYKNIGDNIKAITSTENEITVFQAGVFSTIDNANNYVASINTGIIIKENDLYRVYVGITSDDNSAILMEKYFDSINLNYYSKKIKINNDKFIKELKKHEILLKEASTNTTTKAINEKILKLYKESEEKTLWL